MSWPPSTATWASTRPPPSPTSASGPCTCWTTARASASCYKRPNSRRAQMFVEPREGVGLHRLVELVPAGIEVALVFVRRFGPGKRLPHDLVGPLHLLQRKQRVLVAVQRHRGRRRAEGQDFRKVELPGK